MTIFLTGFPRQFFQPLAQFQFLRRKQFVAESADLSERRRSQKMNDPASSLKTRLAQFQFQVMSSATR